MKMIMPLKAQARHMFMYMYMVMCLLYVYLIYMCVPLKHPRQFPSHHHLQPLKHPQ